MADLTKALGGVFTLKNEVLAPPETQLYQAITDAGLTPPDSIIMDGSLHRFSTNGKARDTSGWYVAFGGVVPAAGFGCWRSNMSQTWRADIGRTLTTVENIEHMNQVNELKRIRDRELAQSRAIAAESAATIWSSAAMASDDHPYLVKKGIKNHGFRIASDGRLIAPVMIDGEITSLQYIDAQGGKLFLKGGKTAGGLWHLGGDLLHSGDVVYIAEGAATASTIHEVTGKCVIVSFSAQNMTATAKYVRHVSGDQRDIVIVADNDESGTGEREALKACEAAHCTMIMPPVIGDANDYVQAGGDLAALLEPPPQDMTAFAMADAIFVDDIGDDYYMPDELVQGLITKGSSSFLYGDSNSGKTFLGVGLACAIALGEPWLGMRTEQGSVLYVAAEAPASIRTRVQAYRKHHSKVINNMAIIQSPMNFFEGESDANLVIDVARAMVAKTGKNPALIILDTFSRISAGANENSGQDMSPILNRIERIGKATGAHILTIHHMGKDHAKGARGWSGIRAHIDTEIEVVENNGMRTMEVTKQRELSSKNRIINFDLQVIEMGVTKWGDTASTCVVIESDGDYLLPRKETKSLTRLRKLFEDALLKYGRKDNDGDLYLTADAWNEYTKESTWASDSARRTAISEAKKKLVDESMIEPKGAGYVVIDADMKAALHLMVKNT